MVSIIIATYNSSKYIIETLNSVYKQTYHDLELIVSDDNSNDSTYEICDKWLEEHKDRFISTQLVKNTGSRGIANNYNNALEHAKGEWIKYLDSDDILLPNCIQDYITASKRKSDINVWLSAWELIDVDGNVYDRQPNTFPMLSARKQLRSYLIHKQDIRTNTFFIRNSTFNDIGGFDSRFPMTQDIPLIYNLLLDGNQFGILKDTYTFQFRRVPSSVSRSGNPQMSRDIAECRYYYSRYYLRYGLFFHWYNAFVTHYLDHNHKKNIFHKVLGYILRCFDIVNIWTKLKF